ncbi:profilin II [Kalaharituber pfeilii]|nr:profilin II [Kalaharituber pfeilii]
MSWQEYVDKNLLGTAKIDKAAIFSKDGTSVWAKSATFNARPEEIQSVIKGFKNANDLLSTGLKLDNEKYILIKNDERSIYAKKGKEGLAFVLTKQTLIAAHYPDTVQPGEAVTIVEGLADYLIKSEY